VTSQSVFPVTYQIFPEFHPFLAFAVYVSVDGFVINGVSRVDFGKSPSNFFRTPVEIPEMVADKEKYERAFKRGFIPLFLTPPLSLTLG